MKFCPINSHIVDFVILAPIWIWSWGLILGLPLGEIFAVKNVASNQNPQIAPMFFLEKNCVPYPPWPYEFMK